MQLVPPPKHHAEVGIRLALYLRVMNSMHSRRDQNRVEQPFQAEGQPHIAVVKKRVRLKYQFVGCKGCERDPKYAHLDDAENRRKQDFAEVETKTGGHVQFRINVVNVVKAPEERNLMV